MEFRRRLTKLNNFITGIECLMTLRYIFVNVTVVIDGNRHEDLITKLLPCWVSLGLGWFRCNWTASEVAQRKPLHTCCRRPFYSLDGGISNSASASRGNCPKISSLPDLVHHWTNKPTRVPILRWVCLKKSAGFYK